MEFILDEKDQQIIEVLKDNSNLSTSKIAKLTKIPITTVHNRIKRLEKNKIILNYTVNLDYKKIGKRIAAFVLVSVDYKALKAQGISQHEMARTLMSYPHVEETSLITGGADIIIKIRCYDIGDLDNFITIELRNIEGIDTTQTMVVLHEI